MIFQPSILLEDCASVKLTIVTQLLYFKFIFGIILSIQFKSFLESFNNTRDLRFAQSVGVVAIEKGVFWSLSTTISNLLSFV